MHATIAKLLGHTYNEDDLNWIKDKGKKPNETLEEFCDRLGLTKDQYDLTKKALPQQIYQTNIGAKENKNVVKGVETGVNWKYAKKPCRIRPQSRSFFVLAYGSLRPDMQLDEEDTDNLCAVSGYAMYSTKGMYPMVTPVYTNREEAIIYGHLLEVDWDTLMEIDKYEDCPNLYRRVSVDFESAYGYTGEACMYVGHNFNSTYKVPCGTGSWWTYVHNSAFQQKERLQLAAEAADAFDVEDNHVKLIPEEKDTPTEEVRE